MFVDARSLKYLTVFKGGSYQDRWNFILSSLSLPPHKKSWSGTVTVEKRLAKMQIYKASTQTNFIEGQNYKASVKLLHAKLFAEKSDGVRLIWEYTDIMFFIYHDRRYSHQISKRSV